VLVVDGHAAVRTALPQALASLGCETATVREGEEALAQVRATKSPAGPARFDLVIMDLVLPRTDGLTLLGQLWNEFPAVTPVLVLGALQDPGAIRELLDLGAADYVAKPFDMDALLYKACVLLGDPPPALFHWAPLRADSSVRVDGQPATAVALSEAGVIVEAPPGLVLREGRTVSLAAGFLDQPSGFWHRCRARVTSLTVSLGKSAVELGFVALSEPQLHRIRRFTMGH
jgi:DNA-binding response OmpR family regulator